MKRTAKNPNYNEFTICFTQQPQPLPPPQHEIETGKNHTCCAMKWTANTFPNESCHWTLVLCVWNVVGVKFWSGVCVRNLLDRISSNSGFSKFMFFFSERNKFHQIVSTVKDNNCIATPPFMCFCLKFCSRGQSSRSLEMEDPVLERRFREIFDDMTGS